MKRKVLSWILVIFWMALIFFLSHQPAAESNGLSSGVTDMIVDIINRTVLDIALDLGSFNYFIRKCAHFFAYMVLGVLVANCLLNTNLPKPRLYLLALLICILYAVSDEIHQIFIPGRSGQVSDVLLDSSGGLVGILGVSAIRRRKVN